MSDKKKGVVRHFYYLAPGQRVIRVHSAVRPSIHVRRSRWLVQEFNGEAWFTPAVSTIMWDDLKTMEYIGFVKLPRGGLLE